MKMKLWIFCLMSCLALAATAQAQPGGGGRGGRGGGGMFGGLFSIIGNQAVQKELGLSEADAEKIKTITDDHGTAMRDAMRDAGGGGGANFQDMTDEERTKMREKMTEASKTVNDKFLPKLKDALTADQFTRLQQINWQNMGAAALSEPEVIKAVSISKDQQDKIKTISDEIGAKRRELFTQGGGGGPPSPETFAKMQESMQELTKEQDTKVNEVLSKAQQDKFASLKGKEFDVAQLRQFGRGGRGGPGGGGGGGGGGRAKRPQPKAE